MLAPLPWLAGFVLLLVALVRATATARVRPRELVGRAPVLGAALAVAALGASAIWVWSGAPARDGRDRIAATGGDQVDAPARARLFLRAVQLMVPRLGGARGDAPASKAATTGTPTPTTAAGAITLAPATVGYAPDATLRLPRRYELDESQRGWDLLEVSGFGARGLRVAVHARPEDTSTRVLLASHTRATAYTPAELARLARAGVTRGGRCRAARDPAAEPAAAELGDISTGAVIAVLCRGSAAVAALAFERDLGPGRHDAALADAALVPLRVTPLVWTRRGFASDHEQLAAGTLLQIGALADAVPGITLWEVPAPRGRAELFFPPTDVLARCDAWIARRGPILPTAPEPSTLPVDRAPPALDTGSTCVLPFAPPYALEVRRLVPDVDGLDQRATWAAALLIAPCLLGLLWLAGGPPAGLTRARVARGLALSWLGVLMAALGVWRLLWAHRLDMMRDYDAVGERVIQNQILIALVAATLAGWSWLGSRARRHGVGAAIGAAMAWAATVVIGGLALRGEGALVVASRGLPLQLAASLALALSPAVSPAGLAGVSARAWAGPRRWLAGGRALDEADVGAWRLVVLGVGAAAIAVVGRLKAPAAVAIKLPLAWAVMLLGYAALRVALAGEGGRTRWRAAAVLAAGLATLAMLVYDAGVTAAVVGPGLAIALVFASHDACFDEARLGRVGSFATRHAPLVRRHAAVLAAVALVVIVSVLVHGGDDLAPAMTRAALRAPLVLAVLLLVVAWHRRRPATDPARARVAALAPWLGLAAILILLWAAQGPLIERVTDSDSRHAARLSIVVDPGYTLLRDVRDFLSGLTAWRETILPPGTGTVATGQGYFGAQVVDPGVRSAIEGDYAPVLFLRETGALGLMAIALLLLTTCAGLWLVAGERFVHGGAAQRTRALVAAVLGALAVYQPLASLGVLPLTGICWPGLGLNSPSDFWLLLALAGWVLMLGDGAADQVRAPGDGDQPRGHDAELRATPVFRRTRRVTAATAALVALAGLALIGRAAVFALRRPSPVDDAGNVTPGFAGLGRAIDYADRLQCPADTLAGRTGEQLVPLALLAEPIDDTTARFHLQLASHWRRARLAAVTELDRFVRDPAGPACRGDRAGWRFSRAAGEPATCRARYAWGWPEVQLDVRAPDSKADADAAASARCAIELPGEALRALRRPARRPYRGTPVRLVARPMGAAALDRGELVAGHVTVRLRPGAGFVDVSRVSAGVFAAETVQLSDELKVELTAAGLRARGAAWTLVKNPPRNHVQVLEVEPGGWRLVEPPASVAGAAVDAPVELPLTSLSVLVVGARAGRNLWLFRPPRTWADQPGDAVDVLLADDVRTSSRAGRGPRRRHYVFGGDLPELGWATADPSMSLGLDGWVQAALAEVERGVARDPAHWREGAQVHDTCGTLAPPTATAAADDDGLDPRVCTASPFDGVLECRVSLQPELAIALRHLTELIAIDPKTWTGVADAVPATEAQYVLLRGDTGELVAQGEFVPGRASSAYAPATPELEQRLVRLLEDRDPRTGAKLAGPPREDSAEKLEWNTAIAVGSTLKPLMARAAELAAPAATARLALRVDPTAACGSRKTAILGHCPATAVTRGGAEAFDLHGFLTKSSNWYMAALGLLGTALPDGSLRVDGAARELDDVLGRDVGGWSIDHPITTVTAAGREVVGADRVDLVALRSTPLWKRLGQILGRTDCDLGDKRACERAGARRDLCAVRALPIAAPNSRQRHLVALGADRFDLYGSGARADSVPVRDYFQFLRGSGLHPVASLAQLADAFGRVVYDQPGEDDRFDLAASWFPVAARGQTPTWDCRAGDDAATVAGAGGGLCGSLRPGGTAGKAMAGLLADPRVTLYGAKTGTIDALGDITEDRRRCERWNRAHAIAGQRGQPYQLVCGAPIDDDGLLLLAFGVNTPTGVVPFTLALRFERVGATAATFAARHYVAAIIAYFTGAWSSTAPADGPTPTPTPAAPTPSPT